jgi:alpha-L-fucosidase 2
VPIAAVTFQMKTMLHRIPAAFHLAALLLTVLPLSAAPISSGRWVAFSQQPATAWQDSFVTGNGNHGTMVCGTPGSERVICVHSELFIRGFDRSKVTVPEIAKLLPEVRRQCVVGGGWLQHAANMATGEARNQLAAMGAPQVWPLCPHPAFDLNLHSTPSGAVTDFRRELDMETGETRTTWRDGAGGYEQCVFSSRIADVNVVRLRGLDGKKLTVELSLTETPGRSGNLYDLNIGGGIREVKSGAEPGRLFYKAKYHPDHGGYEGLARVTTKGGSSEVVNGRLSVKDATEILVVLRVTAWDDGEKTVGEEAGKRLAALPADYDALLAPHAEKHGEMFRRVALDMGCAAQWKTKPVETMLAEIKANGPTPFFYEQMHAMSRNLLISSCGKYAPPLQGIWGGGWKPEWIGGFVLDTNLNLAISNVSVGDLPECAESYFGYVARVLPGWRLNAKNYLGCRGFLVPHYSDPESGYLCHFINTYPWMYWTAGAGWNLMPFYEHAMITGDGAFLRKRVLPLYREMADFYEDWLTKGPDEKLHSVPSISPENFTNGSLMTRDATMDVAVAREVFSHLVTMGRMLKLDARDIAKWQSFLDRLPAYRVNGDGALAEWCDPSFPDNYAHRHSSHLYPVFPGTEFLRPGADPVLLKATQVALDKRFATDTDSAHGLIHVALMAARLHDTAKVAANLDRFARREYVYGGLVTSHNPRHEIYNLDSVLSLPRLMAEMAAFSQPGRIELLPAMPEQFPDGKLTGIRIHGGHKLDIEWKEGRLVSATVHGGRQDVIDVVYRGASCSLALKKDQNFPYQP